MKALSFNVGSLLASVTEVGFGVVVSVVLAGLTRTCSAELLMSAALELFTSPE